MQPEFPEWFTFVGKWMHFDAGDSTPEVCDMLKAGMTCGNDTRNILVAIRDAQYYLGYVGIAICEYCWQEAGLGYVDPLADAEITAYWRDKQREWGVR